MNWTKVKNILIILFMILNVALGTYSYSKRYHRYTLSTERIEQVQELLQTNQIKMTGKIVSSFYPMSKLKIELGKYEDITLIERIFNDSQMIPSIESHGRRYVKGKEELWISRQEGNMVGVISYTNPDGRGRLKSLAYEDVKKVGDQFVKEITSGKGKFVIDEQGTTQEGYRLSYKEVYKGWRLFNSTVDIVLTEKGVVWGQLLRYQPIRFHGEKRDIYPPDEVLLNFIYFIREQYPVEPITIVKMDLGYDAGTRDGTRDIYGIAVPYYRIILETGQIFYINGYTNEIKQDDTQGI